MDNVTKLEVIETREPDLRPPEYSDDALALIFAERHKDELRFVAIWNKWLQWDGTLWRFDETMQCFDLVRRVCREASRRALSNLDKRVAQRVATQLASAKTVAAVEKLARTDRKLALAADQWDLDPWILNTPGGVVDLTTGMIRPNDREDYCTKITAAAPAPEGTDCPLWLKFLDRIMDGDQELIDYLQRLSGYALTGSIKEHMLAFCYGTGRNGKGVYLNSVAGIVGDYASVAAMETFVLTNSTQHPTDLAGLRGARLVTSQETEEGRKWAETKIKSLTGGDPISARFMRRDFFTFTPEFKLIITGNYKPGIRGVDEAIRSRFHLIPFTVTIPKDERDKDLQEKLEYEWPAILRWMIDGCLAWQEHGLGAPEAVRAATEEYLSEEDAFSLWFEECCETSPTSNETTADLYSSWRGWCDKTGEVSGGQKSFSQTIASRNFKPWRQSGTGRKGYAGISLNRVNYADDQRYGG